MRVLRPGHPCILHFKVVSEAAAALALHALAAFGLRAQQVRGRGALFVIAEISAAAHAFFRPSNSSHRANFCASAFSMRSALICSEPAR
jgi:hypothetical protein